MNDEWERAGNRPPETGSAEVGTAEERKSATMLPLIILFQRAWELAQGTDVSLARLEQAAGATALASAILHLLADAGDEEGQVRWSIRLSEARQWCAAIHDALTFHEEQEA